MVLNAGKYLNDWLCGFPTLSTITYFRRGNCARCTVYIEASRQTDKNHNHNIENKRSRSNKNHKTTKHKPKLPHQHSTRPITHTDANTTRIRKTRNRLTRTAAPTRGLPTSSPPPPTRRSGHTASWWSANAAARWGIDRRGNTTPCSGWLSSPISPFPVQSWFLVVPEHHYRPRDSCIRSEGENRRGRAQHPRARHKRRGEPRVLFVQLDLQLRKPSRPRQVYDALLPGEGLSVTHPPLLTVTGTRNPKPASGKLCSLSHSYAILEFWHQKHRGKYWLGVYCRISRHG